MFTQVRHTFELVKFSHTIFALPFALVAYVVATQDRLELYKLFWILVCLVLARTAAMAFNRLVDRRIDAKNPRTQNRHLPAGLLSQTYVLGLVIVSSVGFILASGQLNRLALLLSPFCLAILLLYSFAKRFTHYTQLFLGFSLGMAPIATDLAVRGSFSIPALVLGLAVLFWVAGFDLLYALQDLEFDREQGLHSLTIKLGIQKTFRLAKIFHGVFILGLISYGWLLGLGNIYWGGMLGILLLLSWEHWMLKDDLTKIHAAFFTVNGLLSVFFFLIVLTDLLLH